MCGSLSQNLENPFLQQLMKMYGMRIDPLRVQQNPTPLDIRPNGRLNIILSENDQIAMKPANWWLFQTLTEDGYTYDKRYRSFNTRKDKLYSSRQQDFATQRCIIPAQCFYEWNQHRYRIAPVNGSIAFGGLYHRYPTAEGIHYSCSIITLPPHDRFRSIHDKSFPLMLTQDEITPWLDASFNDTHYWSTALETKIRFDLLITPVDSKSPDIVAGDSFTIVNDDSPEQDNAGPIIAPGQNYSLFD
nr:SOS response-associated peptidase family protein [Pleionea sp. CnH1-48]